MGTLNKITVASEMFMEAHRRFKAAKQDIDYVVSIMMSGSVIGIVGPLLTEQGGHTSHSILARISTYLDGPSSPRTKEGVFRAVYNGLKHAGDISGNVTPSADLLLEVDLEREAAHMLDDAKADFRQIEVPRETRAGLSKEFLQLMESNEGYA
jgi:hypothetical protein